MAHQVHEAAHRVIFGRVVGNSGAAQEIDNFLVCADPDREHRLGGAAALLAVFADDTGHGGGDIIGGSDRGLNIHHENRIVARIGQQRLQRGRIAFGTGVADDIDRIRTGPCRRQHRIELFARGRRDRGRDASQLGQPVDRKHADAAAIGQDRQPLSRRRANAAQRFRAVEQFAQVRNPQDAGAAKRGIVDRVRPGQRAGMGGRRSRALCHAAGFDDDDRLDPGGRARRRHEFAGVLDGLDIKQDGAGLDIEREIIQQVGDIDVELVADRDDPGKTHRALRRPVHHAGGDRARLRNQRQISRDRHVRGETRIEVHAGHHHAKAIGTHQPHAVFARGAFGGIGHRPCPMAEPGGDDQRAGGFHAFPPHRRSQPQPVPAP